MLDTGLRESKVAILGKLAALLREHTADLGEFLSHDPKAAACLNWSNPSPNISRRSKPAY